MRGNVQETSLLAYDEVKKTLNKRQKEVLDVIISSGKPITAKSISRILGLPINSIVPRINELLYDKHLIVIAYRHEKESYYAFNEFMSKNKRKMTPSQKLKALLDYLDKIPSIFVAKDEIIKLLNR